MANSGAAGHAVALPSMGLPDPPSVEPMAVACAAAEDEMAVTLPVDVAIGGVAPAFEGKFPPGEEG